MQAPAQQTPGPLRAAVIGGGAAGYFGAIACAEAALEEAGLGPEALEVVIFESSRRPLQKVRISGGGRCNVCPACFDPAELIGYYPRGARELRGAFARFQPRDTVAWFEGRGLPLKAEADGRMFPTSDDSSDVIRVLEDSARRAGVRVATGRLATEIIARGLRADREDQAAARDEHSLAADDRSARRLQIRFADGEAFECDFLLFAVGGNPTAWEMLRALGHRIESPAPALFNFRISEPALRELAGAACPAARAELPELAGSPGAKTGGRPQGKAGKRGFAEAGALLVTHQGLSGPVILKLSSRAARPLAECGYRTELRLRWMSGASPEELRRELDDFCAAHPRRSIGAALPDSVRQAGIARRLWGFLVRRAGIDPQKNLAELSGRERTALAEELCNGRYAVTGRGVFKDEFVTCGGVSLREIDFRSMESKLVPGLYAAGEALDVDALTGGFNFQSAWTTGWIAGRAIARAAATQA